MPMMFLSRVGSAYLWCFYREVNAPRHLFTNVSEEIVSIFSRNESEKKAQFAGTRTHDLTLIRKFTWMPPRPPGQGADATIWVPENAKPVHCCGVRAYVTGMLLSSFLVASYFTLHPRPALM